MHERYSPMIYQITNKINNKKYIGKTSQSLEKRWYQHCKNAEYGKNTFLYKAIRKYGKENFYIEFISEGYNEEEIKLIEKIKPEYNLTKGGDGGDTSNSPNYRKAMVERDNSGSNNPMWGKRGTDNPNYGKKRTPEQIENSKKNYKGKRIPVVINGVLYDSVIGASKALMRSERYIRLHDQLNKWSY